MDFTQSYAWWQRAQAVLGGSVATLSKNPDRFPQGAYPMFLARGDGCYVWDVDGHRYLDTIASLGPVLLGYNHPAVQEAVQQQIRGGVAFSLPHPLEVEVAERLVSIIPGAETVRFCKNGMDATNAAIRLARYHTDKSHVLFCGYHGGNDSYLSTTDKDGGILDAIRPYSHQRSWAEWDAIETLLQAPSFGEASWNIGDNLAAIMVEVPPAFPEEESEVAETLQRYRIMAHSRGAVFILDEVVTGFRYALGGVQEVYGVQADIVCLGKGLANGYPLAAVSGSRDLLAPLADGTVFLSTTNGGDAVSLAAARATLDALLAGKTNGERARFCQHGTTLAIGLRDALNTLPVSVRGNYARLVAQWQDVPGIATANELKTLWLAEAVKHGVLFGGPTFPMWCYTSDDVRHILGAAQAAGDAIARALDANAVQSCLPCPPIMDVFGQRYAQPESAGNHA